MSSLCTVAKLFSGMALLGIWEKGGKKACLLSLEFILFGVFAHLLCETVVYPTPLFEPVGNFLFSYSIWSLILVIDSLFIYQEQEKKKNESETPSSRQ